MINTQLKESNSSGLESDSSGLATKGSRFATVDPLPDPEHDALEEGWKRKGVDD
jgi:hypothetical protein